MRMLQSGKTHARWGHHCVQQTAHSPQNVDDGAQSQGRTFPRWRVKNNKMSNSTVWKICQLRLSVSLIKIEKNHSIFYIIALFVKWMNMSRFCPGRHSVWICPWRLPTMQTSTAMKWISTCRSPSKPGLRSRKSLWSRGRLNSWVDEIRNRLWSSRTIFLFSPILFLRR